MPQKFYELVPDNFFHLIEYDEYPFFKTEWLKKNGVDAWTLNHLTELIEHQAHDIWFQYKKDGEAGSTYFGGNLRTLVETDFPIVQESIGAIIMSKRLLTLLCSFSEFTYTCLPITIYDGTERYSFLVDGTLAEHVVRNTDYVRIIDLPKIPFDRSNSDFSRYKTLQGKKYLWFYKLSLIEPEDGLPPIFQVREAPEKIFVTKEAAIFMKAQGVVHLRLYDFEHSDYDDIKFWNPFEDKYELAYERSIEEQQAKNKRKRT